LIGTSVLVLGSIAVVTLLHRVGPPFNGIRGFAAKSLLTLVTSLVVLHFASTLMGLPLSGFQVVVVMELLWGGCLLYILWAWRTNRRSVALLFGTNLYLVELVRVLASNLQLAPWYLVPTQVGRVIPKPLLHPVPMIVMGVVMLLLLLVSAYLRRRSHKGAS
jgi:hypothetical protein